MRYTYFPTPESVDPPRDARDWVRWLRDNGIIHDFLPQLDQVCDLCGKGVSTGAMGTKYSHCFNCQSYPQYLDALIVGSYSLFAGLESLVGTFKDNPGSDGKPVWWKRLPLGSLLYAILRKHGSCIERALGPDAVFTWVPSDNPYRSFDHIEEIINAVEGQAEDYPWRKGLIVRDRSVARPARNAVSAAAYTVEEDVDGKSILLLDDLWTSGASMVSAAAALKAAGAATVVGVVLGRQVNPELSGQAELAQEVSVRGWSLNECSLCT